MYVTRKGRNFHGFSRFPRSQTRYLMKVVGLYILCPLQRMPGIIVSSSLPFVTHAPIELPSRRLQPWHWHSQLRGSYFPPACHSVRTGVSSNRSPACPRDSHSTSQTVDPSRLDALPSVSAPPSMIFERPELRWPGNGCSYTRLDHVFH